MYKSNGKIDKLLGCAFLTWSTSDEIDSLKMKEGENEVPELGEWLGIKRFSSFAGLIYKCGERKLLYQTVPASKTLGKTEVLCS